MAIRTKRARMLCKLTYLLGPESEAYMISDGRKPYTFSTAVIQTMELFGYQFWGSNKDHKKIKSRLTIDYLNLMETISDNSMFLLSIQ
jgi:hypothetical protein